MIVKSQDLIPLISHRPIYRILHHHYNQKLVLYDTMYHQTLIELYTNLHHPTIVLIHYYSNRDLNIYHSYKHKYVHEQLIVGDLLM